MFSLSTLYISYSMATFHFGIICVLVLHSFVHSGPLVLCTSVAVSEFMGCAVLYSHQLFWSNPGKVHE